MKIYDQIRTEISLCLASFIDEYTAEDIPIPEERLKDIKSFRYYIQKHDTERDAYLLRKDVKEYAECMGCCLVRWVSSMPVNQLRSLILDAMNKEDYDPEKLLHDMYLEERNNAVRIEDQLKIMYERKEQKMQEKNTSLKDQLKEAKEEIARLKREIKYLTRKLIACRKKLEKVQRKYDELKRSVAANNGKVKSIEGRQVVLSGGPTMWSQSGRGRYASDRRGGSSNSRGRVFVLDNK